MAQRADRFGLLSGGRVSGLLSAARRRCHRSNRELAPFTVSAGRERGYLDSPSRDLALWLSSMSGHNEDIPKGVSMSQGHPRTRRALARRVAALAIGTVLASTTAVGVNPTPASAATCPPNADWVFVNWVPNFYVRYEAYQFTLVAASPTFNVSDSRVAVNGLDTPISVTFTSSQSRTFTIAVTATMQAKLTDWLTATVSSTITSSRTTQIGVSVTASVPAHATIQGEYGVQAYNAIYRVHTDQRIWWLNNGSMVCSDLGIATQSINAPTIVEGWRVRQTMPVVCGEASCTPVQAAYISHFTGVGCSGTESYYTPYFFYDGIRRSWDGQGIVGTTLRTVTNRSWKGADGLCHDDWPTGNTLSDFVTIYR